MKKKEKIEIYYQKEHLFRNGIQLLRSLALQTECNEELKWGIPVYTINGKNVFGICRFKGHFGVWFFNGSFLSDSNNVLRNAQEGKTKGMRHWNFSSLDEIDQDGVLTYMNESIANEKNGLRIIPDQKTSAVPIPSLLQLELDKKPSLKILFESLAPYKQREFCEYILKAKQEKTKARRLEKILPMIANGEGLNDSYR